MGTEPESSETKARTFKRLHHLSCLSENILIIMSSVESRATSYQTRYGLK